MVFRTRSRSSRLQVSALCTRTVNGSIHLISRTSTYIFELLLGFQPVFLASWQTLGTGFVVCSLYFVKSSIFYWFYLVQTGYFHFVISANEKLRGRRSKDLFEEEVKDVFTDLTWLESNLYCSLHTKQKTHAHIEAFLRLNLFSMKQILGHEALVKKNLRTINIC